MADLTGPNPDEVNGLDARDAPLTAQPLLAGARASTATPTAVSADNDSVDLWATRSGALNVVLRDTSGNAIATGVQYVEDAALGAVGAGQGTLIVGRAAAAAPTSVSADADAVGLWASRFGALNIIPRDTAGAALTTVSAALADAFANPTVGGSQTFGMTFNGTNWDRMRGTATSLADALANPGAGLIQGQTFLMGYNGTTWDRVRTVGGVGDGASTGIAVVGGTLYNGSNWDRARSVISDAQAGTGLTAAGAMVFNGSNWDLPRSVQGVTAGANTDRGIAAVGIGPGYARIPVTQSITAVSDKDFDTRGAALIMLSFTGTFTGWSANLKGLADSVPTANTLLRVWSVAAGAYISGASFVTTVAVGGVYLIDVRGYRTIRVSTTAIASGTVVAEATIQAVGPQSTDAFGYGWSGSAWEAIKTANTGRLQVDAVTVPNTYTEDAALGAVGAGLGLLGIARASAAAPTSVSADADAVAVWASRFGALNVILRDTAGGGLTTVAQAFADAFANPTVGALSVFAQVFNGTTWDRLRTASGDALAATGVAGAGNLAYNGTNWDRARAIAALDAAPNVDTGILAIGAGPGWDRKQNPVGVSATSTASAVTVEVDGADVIVFAFTTIGVTPGSMIIETSSDDGTTWVTSGSVLKLGAETWVSGAFVPAVGDTYMCRTTGIRRVRVRVNAVYASGTVTVKWTSSLGVGLIKGMDLAPQPHNIGQAVTNYQSVSLGVTTSGVAIAATAGKRVYITSIRVSAGGTTAGTLAIYSGTGAFTEGTSQTALFTEFAPATGSKPGVVLNFPVPWASATVNEDIRITTTGLTATHIQIQYYIA